MKKKRKLHYAWVVLGVLCLLQSAMVGILSNCGGLFYTPVSKELQCSIADISLSSTISSLCTCFGLLVFARKTIVKFPLKYVLAAANVLVFSRIALAFTDSIALWWILNAVSGLGVSVLSGMTSSVVLDRWFAKKLPTALSIVASFSGITGVVMSYVIGRMITVFGWRTAFLVSTAAIFALTLPTWLLTINPWEKGMVPYGISEEEYALKLAESKNAPKGAGSKLKFSPKVIYVLGLCVLNSCLTAFIAHLATFGTSKELPFDSSIVVTAYMVGNVLFKLVFGRVVEAIGLKRSSVPVFILIIAGLLIMLLGSGYAVLAGSFLFGSSALIYTTMNPLIQRHLFSSEEYPSILSLGIAVYNVTFALLGYVYGAAYDRFSGYLPVLIFILGVSAVYLLALMLGLKGKTENR